MKIDLHMHTSYSPDSLTPISKIMRRTNALGIVSAITDHNTIAGHAEARKIGMEFIPGEEISTPNGDLIGLYLNELIPKRTQFLEAVDLIKQQGGLSYLPHMYDKTRHGVGNEELAKKVDIIEVHNPRCVVKGYNEQALGFAENNGKHMGAGSDSHFLFEIGSTYIECPDGDVSEPKGLIHALDKGRVVRRPFTIAPRGLGKLIYAGKKLFGKV